MPEFLNDPKWLPLITTLITIGVVIGVLQGACAYLVYAERKVSALMQDRIGPNRVGPFGLLQPLADGLKFVFKEEIIPGHVDKFLFLLAPMLALGTATLAFAVVPYGPTPVLEPMPVAPAAPSETAPASQWAEYKQKLAQQQQEAQKVQAENERRKRAHETQYLRSVVAPNIDIGILWTFAISSLGVYGIILGGWASNNKYSFLGALRATAQIISYELPLGLSIIGVVILAGSLNLERIIDQQSRNPWGLDWFIWSQPLAFVLFFTSVLAECNRLPFDLAECEQELIGGFHTEYTALKFGMFFLGEYTHCITTSLLLTVLFLGGWHFPLIAPADGHWILKLLVILGKATALVIFYMIIRWTIPRFRFDQLMGLAWRVFVPLALLNLIAVAVVMELRLGAWQTKGVLIVISLALFIVGALLSLTPPSQPRRKIELATANGERPTV